MLFSSAGPDTEKDESVLQSSAADLWREEPKLYEQRVRDWTARYAGWSDITEYKGTMVLEAGESPVGTDQRSRRIRGQHIPNVLEKK